MSKRVFYQIDVPSGPTATIDLSILHGVQVTDCWVIKTVAAGGVNCSVRLQDGNGNNVSGIVDLNISDGVVSNAPTIDDSFATVNAAEGLRASMIQDGGANTACSVVVSGFPTPTP